MSALAISTSNNEYAMTTSKTPNPLTSNIKVEKEFKAGDVFPISFEIQGEVFQLPSTTSGEVKITHDVFIQASEENILFSLDGENWSEFTELFTGRLGVSTGILNNDFALQAILEANIRQAAE